MIWSTKTAMPSRPNVMCKQGVRHLDHGLIFVILGFFSPFFFTYNQQSRSFVFCISPSCCCVPMRVCSVRPVPLTNTDAPTSVRRGSHVRPALSYLSTALWLAESGWREQSGTSVASRALWDSGLINYECAEMTLSFSFSFYLFSLISHGFPTVSRRYI